MHRASFIRTALRLFLAAFIVSQAHSAFAQTISDPGTVEFDPSPDHSRQAADGTPYLTDYRMSLYVAGQSSPFTQVSLGKPAPQSDGKIRVNFLPLISPLSAGVMYEARVAASGPGGTGTSLASNQFQYSAACTTALSANTQSAGSNAGSGSVNVTSPAGCTWSASSSASWLTITSGASYSGSASVAYSIAANTAQSARTGTMTIAGGTFTVTQAAQSCTTTLSANTQSAGSTAGSGSVNVTSPAGCTWSASSNASWLTLNGASYSGSASVGFNIAANTTPSARTGTMTIAGGTFSVTQAALSCSYALSANSQSLPSAGGTGSVTMTATSGCAWTASSSASWLTVTSGASGTGTGAVAFSAPANTSTTGQTAVLTIAGQTYTVSQAGVSCSYTISPNSQTLATAGGAGSVNVTAPTGCAWAAGSSAGWLTITSGASGSGNGTVSYNVPVNTTTSARVATVSVGGQSPTVGSATVTSVPVADDFNRADGTLGSAWTAQSANTLLLTSASVRGPNDDFVCASRSLASTTFSNDQSSQVAIARLDRADSIGVTVRSSGSLTAGTFSGYLLTADGSTFSTLDKIVSGVGSQILDLSSVAWSAGDVLKLAVSGRTLTAYKNGIAIGTITDPDVASGQPGACIFESSADGNGTSFDDWVGETNAASATSSAASTTTSSAQSSGPALTVTQAGVSCAYALSAASQAFTAAGGTGSVNVSGQGGCGWTASSSAPWLTVTGGASGTAAGTVAFSASANTSTTPRNATLTIAGQTFTVTQAAQSCSTTVSATSQSFAAAGGAGSISVTAPAGCAWSASSSASWLPIGSGTSGTGAGQVTFSATANTTTSSRVATLTVAGSPITVTQAAASCTYAVSPASQAVPSAGGTGTIAVLSSTGCAWTALSGAPWITVTTSASGSGDGAVAFKAAANTSTTSRTASLTIGGQPFTVTQAGTSCTYVVSPLTQSMPASGGSSSVGVTAGTGCAWSVSSSAAWLTPGVGSGGTGAGSVAFTATSNTTSASRTGTLTVAGQSVTVTQGGTSSCNITLNPTTRSINAKATDGTIGVTAAAGCSWTATSSVGWITVTSAVVSKGTIAYSVDANSSGADRTGTITVGGVTFTLTQRSGSTPNPPSHLRVVSGGD